MLNPNLALVENTQIMMALPIVLADLQENFPELMEGKTGFFLSLFDPGLCETEASFVVIAGVVSSEKGPKYRGYSIEKPMRARKNNQHTSFLSRDPDSNKWGGGFWIEMEGCDSFGIGISGLPEIGDALACLIILLRLRIINVRKAFELAVDCKNEDGELSVFLQKAIDLYLT